MWSNWFSKVEPKYLCRFWIYYQRFGILIVPGVIYWLLTSYKYIASLWSLMLPSCTFNIMLHSSSAWSLMTKLLRHRRRSVTCCYGEVNNLLWDNMKWRGFSLSILRWQKALPPFLNTRHTTFKKYTLTTNIFL